LIVCLAAVYSLFVLIQYLFGVATPDGWTSLIISTWFLGGLTIFSLGIIATYLSVMFEEVKGRPYTIIAKIHGGREARASKRLSSIVAEPGSLNAERS
jgi:putative glycosyltransferase